MTLTLTDFLLARIAEDEAMAQRVIPGLGASGEIQIALRTTETLPDGTKRIYTDYVAPYDPNRVLAECEAKRRIVVQCGPVARGYFPCTSLARDTLGILALPHADHPDYRQEWRP